MIIDILSDFSMIATLDFYKVPIHVIEGFGKIIHLGIELLPSSDLWTIDNLSNVLIISIVIISFFESIIDFFLIF